ncbi:MAG: serine/threonine protein kinase, partial [Methylococcales bacterium]|nr:serine/threonine protein kinase [Methylococcales bacterium]
PHDKELVHEISRKTGLFIEPVLTPPEQIRTLIQTHRDKDKAKQKAENVAELATELKSAPQFLLTPRFAEESTYIKNSKSDNDDVDKGVPKNAAPLSSVLGVNSVIRDRFQLTQILGEGGMGTVYLAVDKRKQEAKSEEYNVAIKVLSQSFKDNQSAFITMEREASKTQKLSHPNIVTVNDFDRDEDVIYIVMEYLEGQSLNDFILMFHRKGMPVPKALNIVKDLGDALQYAHDKHIIHCDFKPGNAFITKKNIVKVIDFGIARASSAISKEEVPKFMDEGLLTGCTPSYATPELIFGKDPLPTDDVYALACTTYKLMTGEHPFAGHSSVEAEKLGLHAEKIKGLSRRQWAGLSKALSFNREDRTATVNEFLIEVMPKKVAWSAILISLLMFSLAGLVITQVMPLWKLRLADQMISDVEQNQLSDAELISAYYTKNLGDTATNRVRASVRLSLTGKLLYAEGDELIKNLLLTSQLPEKDLKLVLSLKAIKQKILRYYQQELAKLVDLKKERYSFAQGFSLLAQAQKVSPSSDGIEQLRSRLSQQKADLVAKLQQRIKNAIRKNQLTYTVNKDSVPKALDLFFSIAPKHSSLINGKIADHYYQHALVSLSSGDLAMSTKLLRIMQRFWPDDSRTVGLKVRLKKGPK